jgi:hypothetical protein
MAVYKFRVTFEDYEDVYREIEIKSTQTFEDLHRAIQEAIGFDGKQLASFYMSNDTWRKGREITLMDMSEEGEEEPKVIMNKSKLADFIEDPHQKIIYVFDFMAFWNFFVELVKIQPDNPKVKYPLCSKSVGTAPKQYKDKKLPDPSEEEEEEPKSRKKAGMFDIESEYGIDSGDDELDGFGEEEEGGDMGGFSEFEEQ